MKNRVYRVIIQMITIVTCLLTLLSCAKGPGPNDMIKLSQDEIYFPTDGGTIVIESNFEVSFETVRDMDNNIIQKDDIKRVYDENHQCIAIECRWLKGTVTETDGSKLIKFDAEKNDSGKSRYLKVYVITPLTGKTIRIHQAGAE